MPSKGFRRRALSLTPLVDVIFLLLLFFMLTSTFARYGEIEISAAAAGGQSTSTEDIRFLRLGEESLLLGGREIGLEMLYEELEDQTVLVSLQPDVSSQRLVDLLGALRKIPGLTVSVIR
ncbi:MAG: biopolymer transporter ExbD [Pseudomonadota bacterium]